MPKLREINPKIANRTRSGFVFFFLFQRMSFLLLNILSIYSNINKRCSIVYKQMRILQIEYFNCVLLSDLARLDVKLFAQVKAAFFEGLRR